MNKKLNRFVLVFCVLMMIASFFPFSVDAWSLEDTVRWEKFQVDVTSGASDFYYWTTTEGEDGDIKVETVNTSLKSLRQEVKYGSGDNDNDITKIYLDYDEYTDVDGIEFWFMFYSSATGGYPYNEWIKLQYDFYNDETLKSSVRMYTFNDVSKIQVLDANDTWITLETGITYNTWQTRSLKITYHSSCEYGDLLNYTLKDDDDNIINTTIVTMSEWEGLFDSITEVHVSTLLYGTHYIKSLVSYTGNFAFNQIGYTVEDMDEFDFESTNKIGSIDTTCFYGIGDYKELEFKYHMPVTINATGFDLMVSTDQYKHGDNLVNYDLFINSIFAGHPSEWKEYGNFYVLRWEFSAPINITNSMILFELWHDVDINVGFYPIYWYVGVGCNGRHMDTDGLNRLKHSNTYPNGAFDGTLKYFDVAYQLYYNEFSFIEEVIDVTYDSITTTDVSHYVGLSVPLTYTLTTSNLVYDNYIKIWNDDTDTEITINSMQGFPYLCMNQIETVGFVPFVSANYTAHLYINDVDITNVSFFVNEPINPDMYVYTNIEPSKVGQEIRVIYNFDHPSDKDGAIFFCSSPNLNSYISVNHLSDGDSGFYTETHNSIGTYYYILAVDITGNGTYGIVDNGIYKQRVVSEQGNNFFKLSDYLIRLSIEGMATQKVIGESNLLSGNCYIYDNNKLIKTITESPFTYSYNIYTAGIHTVEMRLITNVTTILFTQNYSVSTFTGEDEYETEDTSYILHDWVYDLYGDIGVFALGVGVVLGFMFIPFALVLWANISYNKNISLSDLHWSIYIIFAIVGVIVDVQLHLAELWIILLVCVVSIAIAVITWKGNRQ